MNDGKIFADQAFRIECSTMVLHARDGKPPIAQGPGEIWQDENGRLHFKIFINQQAYLSILTFISRPRQIGQLIPPEDYLTLEARAHSLAVWTSHQVMPGLSGAIVDGGLAKGPLYDLVCSTEFGSSSDTATIAVRLKGKLDFPCNQGTETVIRVGGKDRAKSTALNAAFFETGSHKFNLLHEGEHTVLSLQLPLAEMTPHTAMRMVEALQFVLGRELNVMSTETVANGQSDTRLISPRHGDGAIHPPLAFSRVDEGGNIWRMFCDYFMFIRGSNEPQWHPITRYVGSVIEASSASIGTQVLALGVAVEGMAGEFFEHLAPNDPQLLADITEAEKALKVMELTSKARILGSLNAMKKARNSDIVREFVSQNGLDVGLFQAWRKLRNSSAHGDADAHEIEKLVKLRHETISLLYSMSFQVIGYAGPRTDSSLPNFPVTHWPIPPAEAPPLTR